MDTPKAELRILTYDDIIGADDVETRTLEVPEWSGAVRIRTFSKDTEMRMRAEAREQGGGEIDSEYLEMLMLVHGLVDPVLTPDLIPHLRTKSAAAVNRILEAIVDMNRMTKEAVAKAAQDFPKEPGETVPVQAGA